MPGSAMDFDAVSHAAAQAGRLVGMGPRAWFEVNECQAPGVADEVGAAASRFAAALAAVDASLTSLHDGVRSAVTVAWETDRGVGRDFSAAIGAGGVVAGAFRV